MTTGSLSGSESERRWYAARSRWWNSTGGGSGTRSTAATAGSGAANAPSARKGIGAVKAGDGGAKFRAEWPDIDQANWAWMERERVDAATGTVVLVVANNNNNNKKCSPEAIALLKGPNGAAGASVDVGVVGGVVGQAVRGRGQGWVMGWMGGHKLLVGFVAVVAFVLMQRLVAGVEKES